jgi:hypothetical protein
MHVHGGHSMNIKMKCSLLAAVLGLYALAAHADAKYHVTLTQASQVGKEQLKAGEYHVVLDESKVVFTHLTSGDSVEVPATIQRAEQKHAHTSIRMQRADGENQILEIKLGGTQTRILFP